MALVAIEDRFDGKRPINPKFVMIVDKSGSMFQIRMPMLHAINNLIDEQKALSDQLDDNASLTVITFADEAQTIMKNVPLKSARHIEISEYEPDGWTALYDAIGMGFIQYEHEKNVVFVIVTDGEENKSKYWTKKQISETIEEKKKLGWNFIYLANGQSVANAGVDIGITSEPQIATSSQTNNINVVYDDLAPTLCRQVSRALSAYRQTSEVPNLNNEETLAVSTNYTATTEDTVNETTDTKTDTDVNARPDHIANLVSVPVVPVRSSAHDGSQPPPLVRANAMYYSPELVHQSNMKTGEPREPLDEGLSVLVPGVIRTSSDESDEETNKQNQVNELDFHLQHP